MGGEDQDLARPAREQPGMQEQTGLDGFSGRQLVGQEDPWGIASGRFGGDVALAGDGHDARPHRAEDRRSRLPLPGEQASSLGVDQRSRSICPEGSRCWGRFGCRCSSGSASGAEQGAPGPLLVLAVIGDQPACRLAPAQRQDGTETVTEALARVQLDAHQRGARQA